MISSFVLSFLIFPAAAMFVKRDHITSSTEDTSSFTMFFAKFTEYITVRFAYCIYKSDYNVWENKILKVVDMIFRQ